MFADAPVEVLGELKDPVPAVKPVAHAALSSVLKVFSDPCARSLSLERARYHRLQQHDVQADRQIQQLKHRVLQLKAQLLSQQRKMMGFQQSRVTHHPIKTRVKPIQLSAQLQRHRSQLGHARSMKVKRPEPAVDTVSVLHLYQQGLSALQAGHVSLAQGLFRQYLHQRFQGQYTAQVYFYLGDLALTAGEFPTAMKYFSQLIHHFKKFSNTPEAYLKYAQIMQKLGHDSEAVVWRKRLVTVYPKSDAAQLARLSLDHVL